MWSADALAKLVEGRWKAQALPLGSAWEQQGPLVEQKWWREEEE
jgi:hypothetical protein